MSFAISQGSLIGGGGGGGVNSDVNVLSSALPNGAATEITLAAINTKTPSLSGGRVPVDGSGVTQPVTVASLPLPADASTATNQSTIISSLSNVNNKLPSLSGGRIPVDGSGVTQPVTVASLPLPTDASTATNQSTIISSLSTINNKLPALSGGRVPVDGSGVTQPVTGTVSVSGTLSTNLTQVGSSALALGQTTAANSIPVVIASNQSSISVDTEFPSAAALSDSLPANTSTVFVGSGIFALDGSNWSRVRGNANGLYVQGPTANGAAASGSPVRIGGWDGGNVRTLLTDTSGRMITVQSGLDSNSTNRTASVNFSGAQVVSFDNSNTGPFGDLIAEPKYSALNLHWSILNAFDPQLDEIVTQANGATVSVTSQRLTLISNTTNLADACYRSIKTAQYRPGQGFIFRWTAAFTTNAASSTQEIGFGNGINGGGSNAIAIGYNGTSFGILYRNAGVPNWTSQNLWNGDKLNGSGPSGITINPANLNVFFAHVPYLGAGAIRIFAMLPSGEITRIHTIQYPNSSPLPEFSDPAFRFYGRVVSSGSTTNLTAYSASAAAFTIGEIGNNGQQWAENRTVSVNGTSAVLSLRCATSVNGVLNNTPLRIRSISFTSDNGNTTATCIGALGVTLGGVPSFAALTGKSATTADNGITLTSATTIGTIDIAGTTVTGGNPIWNTATPRNSAASSGELEENPIYIYPGQTLTFYAITTAAANITVAINGTIG